MLADAKFLALRLMPGPLRKQRLTAFYEKQGEGSGERELRELPRFVKAEDYCLDVGCNIGVYSYHLSKLGGKVIAFEPNPDLAKLVSELGLPNVEMRQVALSNVDGTAELTMPRGVDAGHAFASLRSDAFGDGPTKVVSVPTCRLDSMELPTVSFIKIDVEGFEEQVVEGAMATLGRDQPILLIEIEERHNEGGLARIAERLGQLDYSGWFMRDGEWLPLATFDLQRHQPPAGSPDWQDGTGARNYINNFLFLPHGRTIQD
ncbi:MAG: FkbM family methyltransferase [Erythrobacter sp.]|uniref:FkbM family methyltransferase n=1 Tax=Erythrobacter sp. TaxID=1042 RepID=UPI0025F660F5|nr:FkbM family methyltransferase [Erythrobacter sp.]MCM0000687.1 FkbM family methyltransferase [Erythrobacter sp.]